MTHAADHLPTRQFTPFALLAVLCLFLSACQSSPDLLLGTRLVQPDFGQLIAQAPIVVVAVSRGKSRVGPSALMTRPPDSNRLPVKRFACQLQVVEVLRGDVAPVGSLISFLGYEADGLGTTGPRAGICGRQGEASVYFLERQGQALVSLVDHFSSDIPLPDDDLGIHRDLKTDLPEAIWRRQLSPWLAARRNASARIDFQELESYVGPAVGRAWIVRRLSQLSRDAAHPQIAQRACLHLNQGHAGFGGESCLIPLRRGALASGDVALRDEADVCLRIVETRNRWILELLSTPGTEALRRSLVWKTASPDAEIRNILDVLREHPLPSTARLARSRLGAGIGGHRRTIP